MTITHTCFNQTSMVNLIGPSVSITSIEEPTDEFMHVTPDIRFKSEKISHKSDK